ncbi:hypothetical protein FHETE_6272 [Fusarium heterosporum]|uniref:Uncharacterized protein n=1 Tax=Fusarium heterosporum TaxID=42747 RepID=A0A8H5TB39_FUSHE|nr:hypothetical protein FHETE_6272 [Fusarium heterosporum]
MPRSNKTNSGKSQQVLRRSTRSNRGQLDPFLLANYVVGEAASRASSGPRRRRATMYTSTAGSAADGEEESGDEEGDDDEEEDDDGEGDKEDEIEDEEEVKADDQDEIQDCATTASQISQPNHVQQFPLQQQQVLPQQVVTPATQQSQSGSPTQVQQTVTPALAHQPMAVQPDQTMTLQGVEDFETNLRILDHNPLFGSVPQDWSIPEL